MTTSSAVILLPGEMPEARLYVVRQRRSRDVIAELDRRRHFVDVLAARAGGADEVFRDERGIERHWSLVNDHWSFAAFEYFDIGHCAALQRLKRGRRFDPPRRHR